MLHTKDSESNDDDRLRRWVKWWWMAKIPHNFIWCGSVVFPHSSAGYIFAILENPNAEWLPVILFINTCLDNDAENELLFCATIMRRHIAWEGHTVSGRNVSSGQSGNMHTKIIVCIQWNLFTLWYTTNWFQLFSLLNIFGYLRKICCLSKALNLCWFRLVYLKTEMKLHSCGLLQKQHRIGKYAFGTDYFLNWPVFGAKRLVLYRRYLKLTR